MTSDPATLLAHKKSIVDAMFLNTADENYIAARWCFFRGLPVDFLWLSVHAIEKYFKATLLLNGRSAKVGHELPALLTKVLSFASDLLPSDLRRPQETPSLPWSNETFQGFVARLSLNGCAENRYQVFGYAQRMDDLAKVDQVVAAVRALCVPLDVPITNRPKAPTHRTMLRQYQRNWHLGEQRPLEKTRSGERGPEARHALLDWNFPFAPDDFEHTPSRPVPASAANPVLKRRILDPLMAGSPRDQQLGGELRDWVLKNIKLGKHVTKCLTEAACPSPLPQRSTSKGTRRPSSS